MKSFTNIVAALAVVVMFSGAAANARDTRTVKTKKPHTVENAAPLADTRTNDPVYNAQNGRSILALSGPVTFISGTAYWGVYGDYLREVMPNTFLGGETGFQFHSESAGNTSFTSWIIPILLTGIHYCDQSPVAGVTPFIGASIGLGILHTPGITFLNTSTSDTSAKFEGLAHLGAAFGMSRNFFGDVRIGTVDGSFLIAPTIGYYF